MEKHGKVLSKQVKVSSLKMFTYPKLAKFLKFCELKFDNLFIGQGMVILFPDENSFELLDEIFKHKIYHVSSPNNNPLIVDIGSHVGLSIIYFNRLFPESKIFGYESNPELFSLLKKNIKNSTDANNIKLFNKAVVSKGRYKRVLYETPGYSVGGSLYKENVINSKFIKKILVSTVTLDEILKLYRKIDILKIDAEGVEYELIPIIVNKSNLIDSLIIEIHRYSGYNWTRLINLLEKKYELFILSIPFYQYRQMKDNFFLKNYIECNPILVYGRRKY